MLPPIIKQLHKVVVTNLQQLFHLPISAVAFDQLVELANNIQNLPLSDDHDIWSYIWGSHKFASSKVYLHLEKESKVYLI